MKIFHLHILGDYSIFSSSALHGSYCFLSGVDYSHIPFQQNPMSREMHRQSLNATNHSVTRMHSKFVLYSISRAFLQIDYAGEWLGSRDTPLNNFPPPLVRKPGFSRCCCFELSSSFRQFHSSFIHSYPS